MVGCAGVGESRRVKHGTRLTQVQIHSNGIRRGRVAVVTQAINQPYRFLLAGPRTRFTFALTLRKSARTPERRVTKSFTFAGQGYPRRLLSTSLLLGGKYMVYERYRFMQSDLRIQKTELVLVTA